MWAGQGRAAARKGINRMLCGAGKAELSAAHCTGVEMGYRNPRRTFVPQPWRTVQPRELPPPWWMVWLHEGPNAGPAGPTASQIITHRCQACKRRSWQRSTGYRCSLRRNPQRRRASRTCALPELSRSATQPSSKLMSGGAAEVRPLLLGRRGRSMKRLPDSGV